MGDWKTQVPRLDAVCVFCSMRFSASRPWSKLSSKSSRAVTLAPGDLSSPSKPVEEKVWQVLIGKIRSWISSRRRDDIQLRIFPIKTCHTFSSTGLLGDDRSPGASVTARDDFDDSFDHGRLAENRIEQNTQTASRRGTCVFQSPIKAQP